MLAKRCANNTDRLIFDHLIQSHSLTVISCGEKTFTANKGSPQGGVCSPSLLNVYLHEALNSIPTLKNLVDSEQILCFADDMVVRVRTKKHAEEVIRAIEALK